MSIEFDIKKIDEGLDELPLFFPFMKDGKMHHEPNEAMSEVHKRLYKPIRSVASKNLIFAVGGSLGCDTYINAWTHTYRGREDHFYILDLKNAFSQIKAEDLVSVFARIMPSCDSSDVNTMLSCYFMEGEKGLLRGAPASPDLFNACMSPFDEDFLELCDDDGVTGTRYMDDICVSGYDYLGKSFRKRLRKLIHRHGFELNHRKSQVLDLKKGPIKVTGLYLDAEGRISIPNRYKREFKGVLYRVLKGDETISREKVEGRWGYFSWIHIKHGARLTKDDREIVRMYAQYRRMIGKPLGAKGEATRGGKVQGSVRASFE